MLIERQGCSRAQLYRDLGALAAAGWPVDQTEPPGSTAVYRLRVKAVGGS